MKAMQKLFKIMKIIEKDDFYEKTYENGIK